MQRAFNILLVHFQKFACNGTVIEHPEYGEVIQLQGDQRKNICQFLTDVSMSLGGFWYVSVLW